MLKKTLPLLALAGLLAACAPTPNADAPAPRLNAEFAVLAQQEDGFRAALTLENDGNAPLPADGWQLYFNFWRRIHPESLPDAVTVEHVNGDLFRLVPTGTFAAPESALAPGASVEIPFDGDYSVSKVTDAPAGMYLVHGDDVTPVEVTVAPFARAEPSAASRYAENASLSLLDAGDLPPVLPTPRSWQHGNGTVEIGADATIAAPAELRHEADFLANVLARRLGTAPAVVDAGAGAAPIVLELGSMDAEGYRLQVGDGGVRITGGDAAGVFYGVQSLRALLPLSGDLVLPAVTIEDAPGFPYRGMHLDVARNFQTRESVERFLDVMAFYKLNRFHFHLTDDEGWRLEIPGLPELTEIGGRRCHTVDERDCVQPSLGSGPTDDTHGSGHYSREDFVEILRSANARHIEVIPEVDVPGHAHAAIKAMEARHARLLSEGDEAAANEFLLSDPEDASEYASVQMWNDNVLNVCMESTYHFLAKVVDEMATMYADAGAPFHAVHIGGDEVPAGVWEKSPACAAFRETQRGEQGDVKLASYFFDRLATILAERGLTTAGWEEIGLEEALHGTGAAHKEPNPANVERGFQLHVWNNLGSSGDLGYRLANAGYKVVLSNATNLYFDLAYNRHPEEPGLYWAGLVDTRKAWELVPLDLFAGSDAGNTRLTAAGRENVLGIQGQLWGENVKGRERMEYLAFPKLLGLAERAWTPSPEWASDEEKEADWNVFVNVLGQREMPRLDTFFPGQGVGYRLPPPGAVVEDGMLKANVAFPGLAIRTTTDGTEPTETSALYEGPVAVAGDELKDVRLRSFSTDGRGSRTTRPPRG